MAKFMAVQMQSFHVIYFYLKPHRDNKTLVDIFLEEF